MERAPMARIRPAGAHPTHAPASEAQAVPAPSESVASAPIVAPLDAKLTARSVQQLQADLDRLTSESLKVGTDHINDIKAKLQAKHKADKLTPGAAQAATLYELAALAHSMLLRSEKGVAGIIDRAVGLAALKEVQIALFSSAQRAKEAQE